MLKSIIAIIIFIFGLSVFISCQADKMSEYKSSQNSDKVPGPQTIDVNIDDYQKILYVSSENGSDDDGDGSMGKPWRSPDHALSQIHDAKKDKRYAVLISVGEYSNNTIQLKDFVDLYGGFSNEKWQRDIIRFPSYLSGEGKRRVLIGANNAKLDGFVIYRGQVRGKGAGIFCDGVSPVLSNNIFWRNKTLKPKIWNPRYRHEISNDGAAIYLLNGSAAEMANNLFIENSTENGRGAGIAAHTKCKPLIIENVFLNNVSGLDDPMRSSDGAAISVFDWCDARIENNIVLNNKALASNDAGGIFIALWSSAVVKGNVFVNNDAGDDAGALFVGGQEHRYDAPLDPIPPKDKFFVEIKENLFIGNTNSSMNSGAMRFTMESRGVFQKNITAFNNGIYFQRSEVKVSENIILDNFLFVETKEGLNRGEINDNLIWAGFDLMIDADVHNNRIKGESGSKGYSPDFRKDAMELIAGSVIYQRKQFVTRVILTGQKLKKNELANRVVRAGEKWGVIKTNDADTITLWGDFTGEMVFRILPTYTIQ